MMKRRGCIRFAVFVAIYVAYLCMGAGVFSAVEQPKEKEINKVLISVKNAFYDKISDLISEEELDSFLHVMLAANDKGISVIQNSSRETNWGIGQSFFFAGSIVTTIGYGNVTPQSYAGRIFCIVYAAVGIPLTLIMMTTLVERMLGPCTALFLWLQRRLGPSFSSLSVRLIHLTLIAIVTLTLVFFLPAVVFMAVEPKWSYLDALYFCVISMTTIGLDDYVPGEAPVQPYRQLYKICATVYLLLGLMMMMLLLATVYEIPELNISRFFRSSSEDEEHKLLGEGGTTKYSPQVNEGFEGSNETGKTHVARQTSKQ